MVMSWTSAYNQVLCAFFLLASFWSLLLYVETEQRRYLVLQWVMFLLGFGALEINVVYPAIAAAFVFLEARKHFRSTLWLFLPSIVYASVHFHYAPVPVSGPYRMHWDADIWGSLWDYWAHGRWVPCGCTWLPLILPYWVLWAATQVLTAGILGFVLVQLRKRNGVPAFLLLWFLLLLAPVLPLRDHLFDHYLTMPTIGLAVLGAWGLVGSLESPLVRRRPRRCCWRPSTLQVPFRWASLTRWNYHRGRASRTLVRGLARAHELHPDKLILLTGVSNDLFWSTFTTKRTCWWESGTSYLVPGSEDDHRGPSRTGRRVGVRASSRARHSSPGRGPGCGVLRRRGKAAERDNPFPDHRPCALGPAGTSLDGWRWAIRCSPINSDPPGTRSTVTFRWMPKRATVVLHGPAAPGARLFLNGYCPRAR